MDRVSDFTGQLISKNLSQGVKVELFGQWIKTRYLISQLPRELRQAGFMAEMAVAEKYKRRLVKNIKTNKFGFSLKQSYAIYKAKKGGSPGNVLFWTGFYISHIMIIRNPRSKMVNVTIKKNVRYPGGTHGKSKPSALTLEQIALILEKGSDASNIEARPVWSLTFQDIGGKRGVKRILVRTMATQLRLKFPHIRVR